MEEMITISKKEYEDLLDASLVANYCLESCGMDFDEILEIARDSE